jgi:Dullard-like phosphatase family protein
MNQNKITDTIINLFLTRITNPKSPKLSNLVKELKTFPSINYLLESLNINKISSNYPSEPNQEQEVYEFDSEEENPNENDNLVFNIIENDTEKTIRQDKEQTPKKFYLNPINPKYKYTLVLDLDETLVHYISDNESAYIQIRPGTEDFIKDLSKYYEIIIFTAALKKYADVVINSIDPDGNISYRLYRQHTISIGNSNIKDLTKLGRDLRYVIIVDNCLENFALQSRNGLKILDFEGNEFDDELEYLKDDLIKLVKMNVNDVRDYLENIQISMDKRAKFYEKLNFNINNNNNNFNNELVNYKDYYNDNINLDENIVKKSVSSIYFLESIGLDPKILFKDKEKIENIKFIIDVSENIQLNGVYNKKKYLKKYFQNINKANIFLEILIDNINKILLNEKIPVNNDKQ